MERTILCLGTLLFITIGRMQVIVQKDAAIEQMAKEVSSDSLKAYVAKLETFGTRSTLSTTTNEQKGIGAAREWVVQKFNEFGKSSIAS